MWLEVINYVRDVISSLEKEENEKKEKISKLFLEISELLFKVSNDLENDVFPHDSCATMSVLSENLYDITKNVLPEHSRDHFYYSLKECSYLERDFALRQLPNTIINLKNASGEFKAMSMLITI